MNSFQKVSIFLFIFFIHILNSIFAFSISDDPKYPYRIYIGKNKDTDWIDVVSVGYFLNEKYKILFIDDSPIEKIYLDENILGERFYWIIKGKSMWKFFDEGINSRLHLMQPSISSLIDEEPYLVPERQNKDNPILSSETTHKQTTPSMPQPQTNP